MGNEPELAIASILLCRLAHPLTERALSSSLESHLFILTFPRNPLTPQLSVLQSPVHYPSYLSPLPLASLSVRRYALHLDNKISQSTISPFRSMSFVIFDVTLGLFGDNTHFF